MATNILSLPLARVRFSTGLNEDWLDALPGADGVSPLDLTGVDFRMQLRLDVGRDPPIVELSLANGRLAQSGAGGVLSIAMTAAQVASLIPPGVYVCDVVATADQKQRRVLEGTATIFQGVTR